MRSDFDRQRPLLQRSKLLYSLVKTILSKNRTNSVEKSNMALTQKLKMRQSQALVMTPQLMQAIKLLQLSNLDLAAYVEGELERNPLLERAGDGEQPAAERERTDRRLDEMNGHEPRPGKRSRRATATGSTKTSRPAASTIEARLDTDLENVFPDDASQHQRAAESDEPPSDSRLGTRRRRRARTATTISKPSSRPSRRSPTIWPSNLRWRSPIRRAA